VFMVENIKDFFALAIEARRAGEGIRGEL